MSVFTGAIVRPGASNLAFQIVKIHIYTGIDTPCITKANKADHLTIGTGAWRIEQAPVLTHAVARTLFPSVNVPISFYVSKYHLVCCGDPIRSYRIFGLKWKPRYMPARDGTMEIAKRTSIATQAYLDSVDGHLMQDVIRNHFDTNGWYKPSELISILRNGAAISCRTSQSTVSTSITIRTGGGTHTVTSFTSQFPSLPLPSLQIPRVHVPSFSGLPPIPTTPVSATYAAMAATVKPLCQHVAKIIANDARTSGGECPITFDSFQDIAKFCVPVCGHVCSESASQLSRCPVCREATSWSLVELPVETA